MFRRMSFFNCVFAVCSSSRHLCVLLPSLIHEVKQTLKSIEQVAHDLGKNMKELRIHVQKAKNRKGLQYLLTSREEEIVDKKSEKAFIKDIKQQHMIREGIPSDDDINFYTPQVAKIIKSSFEVSGNSSSILYYNVFLLKKILELEKQGKIIRVK